MTASNPLRAALEDDEIILGGDVRTFAPEIIDLFGNIDLDYAWFDFEHSGPSPWDSAAMDAIVRSTHAADIEPVVRLPDANPKLIGKVLDTGVRTLVIPQAETGADVDRAVQAARYPGDAGSGTRGIGPGRSTLYGCDLDGYVDDQNAGVLVGAMIENAAAVNHVEEILHVPHLGFLFIGPADLSISMTGGLAKDDPMVVEAIETVVDAASDAGVPVGKSFPSIPGAEAAIDRGYQMLTLGKDVAAVHSAFRERVTALR